MNCTLEDKKSFVMHCIKLQIDSKSNVERLIKAADEEAKNYGPPKDRYDGFVNQQMRRIAMFSKQLDDINRNLDLLGKIDLERVHDTADFGAFMRTERAFYLISVGMGATMFGDTKVFVLSKSVPLFEAMAGKRVGESFEFNGVKQTILEMI